MKKTFFIYSLPRSGSAWLSLFLSQPGAFCFHEPLADEEDLQKRMDARPEEVVGAIDTSAYLNPLVLPSETKTYILWRDWDQIEASSLRIGYSVDARTEQMVFRQNLRISPGNTIRYNDLGSLSYLETLWTEIVGMPFDRERAEYLIEMQVERSVSSIVKRLKKWRTNI